MRQPGFKHSLETRLRIGQGNKGKVISAQSRLKMSLSKKGRTQTQDHKEKNRQGMLKRWQDPVYHKKMRDSRISSGRKVKELWKTETYRNKVTNAIKYAWSNNEKFRRGVCEGIRKSWQDKEKKEKRVRATIQGLLVRPTSLEQDMIGIIQRNFLPYRYTGNGDVIIGGKNPDFVNVNGAKICIEVGNTFHHEKDYSDKRKSHFAKYGWDCVVFISNKLNEQEVVKVLSESII